ncbi:DUF4238 domain-containing protein [Micromonospora sp. CPCC 206061]|uniref:DUF4238 domain-containing protein n=1 Tax=Micromonospora sp. CPCC 206061 TaxID=3122410 RepID=UPI002FEF809A
MAGNDEEGRAEEWPFPGDPNVGVGSRHHIVPRFYLERWANTARQIEVVEKPGGDRRRVNIKEAGAEKDFYTFIDLKGGFSGYLEQLLSHIEGRASSAISNIVHPTFGIFPPPPDDKHALATLLAFQAVRGKRTRKSIELQADLLTRLQLSGIDETQIVQRMRQQGEEPTEDRVREAAEFVQNLDEYRFVPDPNDHLRIMGEASFRIYKMLMRRHWYLAEFSGPLLLTCDEPVVRYTSRPNPLRGIGFLNAEEIWFPLSPRLLLILCLDVQPLPPKFPASIETAVTANQMLAHNAYQYIYLHPNHDVLPEIPPDEAVFKVTAAGFPMLERYNEPPYDKRTQRRRKQK